MPLTKAQIIASLSLLPLSKLEILNKYQEFLIVPTDDTMANVTMSQMVQKAHDLADVYFPDWTDRSETDFGEFLVQLMALFSEKDFWYINAFANQSLLTKMTVYSMAFIRSVELGYRADLFTAATAPFTVIFDAGAVTNYDKGQLIIQLADGTKFTNSSVIALPLTIINYPLTTTLMQGAYNTETYSFNGRSVDLRKIKIDIETIDLYVEGVLWTKVEVFGSSGSSSTDYIVLPEEDGRCSIFFGEDGYGAKPIVGALIEVTYLNCTGVEGNVVTQTATVSKSVSTRIANAVTMNADATNGLDAATLGELKNKTLNYFNYRKAVLNEDSAKLWLMDQAEVSRAQVIITGNIVVFFFVNASGTTPSVTEIADVTARITPLISNGYFVNYAATTNINASTIDVTLYYLTGYDAVEIESLAKQLIQDFTDPIVLAEYDEDFGLNDVSVLLLSKIPGLNNVTFNTVAGLPAADITVGPGEILDKIALTNITATMVAI